MEDTASSLPIYKEIALSPIAKGENIVLRNLFFALNSAELQTESFVELDKLWIFLQKNWEIRIEISGHTDNQGSATYNQTLSENRALAVKKYLETKGIPASRLTAVGYGFSKPLDTNDTPEGRAQNRRTEIKIL
ncbi:MAG: OmpA family protein [Bacteroidales bacterium]